MATMQDFSGLLFGGGGTGLEGFITPEQQQAIQQQSMLQAASALLSAGGPRREPISLGQALGGALQAGQAGYQQAQQGAIQNLLAKQKLTEGAMEQARMLAYLGALQNEGLIPAVAGQGGIPPIPAGAGGVPPAGSAPTATMPSATTPTATTGGGLFAGLTPEQKRLLPLLKPTEAIAESFKAAGQKASQLSESELTGLGLPPTTLAYKLPSGETKIVYRPDYQWIETPSGGKQLMDMNNPLSIVPKPVQDRVVASGTVPPKTTAGATTLPTYGGGMAPALKPEQIMTAVQDWDTKYRTPVESILSSYNIVKDLVQTGEGGISDYGVLIKSIKALDPTSAVMQGEANAAAQMQGMADRMQGLVEKIAAGGVGSEQARLDLANLARSSAKVAVEAYNRQADRKAGLLRQYVPQSVIDSTFQKYTLPPEMASKAEFQKSLKANTAAPSGNPVLTWNPQTKQWGYQ
jgi:hypothetical protein